MTEAVLSYAGRKPCFESDPVQGWTAAATENVNETSPWGSPSSGGNRPRSDRIAGCISSEQGCRQLAVKAQ